MINAIARALRGALIMLGVVSAAVPVSAAPANFSGIGYDKTVHKWSVGNWNIWALPNHECLALFQKPDLTPFNFWGFRVIDGLKAQMIFGSIADAAPQTIQITFNDGPPNNHAAKVEPFLEWNAYVIPIQLEELWAFPDELFFDVYVGGSKVTWGGSKVMGKVAEGLEKCDTWQQAH